MGTYYVCNASRYLVPNLIPLLELGLGEVDGVILLVGAGDPPSDTDYAEALGPAERFEQVLQDLAGNRNIRVERVPGAPQDYGHWPQALSEKIAELGDGTYHVNVTAGTTAMTLGGVVSVLQVPEGVTAEARVLAFHPNPPRLIQIYPQHEEKLLAPSNRLRLGTYLHLYGWQEFEAGRRQAGERAAAARMPLTQRICSQILRQPEIALSALNRIFTPLARRRFAGPRQISVAEMRNQLAAMFNGSVARTARDMILAIVEDAAANAPGLVTFDSGLISCPNEDAAKYFAGTWLEEWTAQEVRQTLAEVPDASVHCQLRLANRSDPMRPVREIDVAVFYRDQLHAVECKTALYKAKDTDVSGLDYRAAIVKLSDIKRNLVGPFGVAAILNPRIPPTERAATRHFVTLVEEGRHGGIALWCGPDAVAQCCNALIDNMRRGEPGLPLRSLPVLPRPIPPLRPADRGRSTRRPLADR